MPFLKDDISNAEIRAKLEELYGHPGNVDLWVGGLLEDPLPGARIGPTFTCILVDQFRRLRDGDRFWYENPTTFKPDQLAQIRLATLGRVLCDNGDHISDITKVTLLFPLTVIIRFFYSLPLSSCEWCQGSGSVP